MLKSDEVEFIEFSIRGREYDAKLFGIHSVTPPRVEAPYWKMQFEDGTELITTDIVTIRFRRK